MRVIDAFTGRAVNVGDVVPLPGHEESWKLLAVHDGFWKATIDVEYRGDTVTWPLIVRLFHPQYLLERVGFVNT